MEWSEASIHGQLHPYLQPGNKVKMSISGAGESGRGRGGTWLDPGNGHTHTPQELIHT